MFSCSTASSASGFWRSIPPMKRLRKPRKRLAIRRNIQVSHSNAEIVPLIHSEFTRAASKQRGFGLLSRQHKEALQEMRIRNLAACFIGAVMISTGAFAQVTPAAGYTPPDDTPKINVGAVVFADYTYVESPKSKDADGNAINNSSFNVTRAYINITGNLNHLIAFRITPDISRETNTTPSLSGSQIFRLKYAYAQLNLDDWTTKGSWVRFGQQQTPYLDYSEGIYRYRFQGTMFAERVGLISSADAGLSGHYAFNGNYGDVHA